MIKSLIKISNFLDANGHYSEANRLNQILAKIAKEKKEKDCPEATQNLDLNLKNRQKGIDKYLYGPMNPALDNKESGENNDNFWKKIAKIWSGKSKVEVTIKQAKTMRCSNCAAFDVSPEMKKCIASGIEGSDKSEHSYDTIKAGTLGYCNFLNFKCASKRTCKAWVAKD